MFTQFIWCKICLMSIVIPSYLCSNQPVTLPDDVDLIHLWRAVNWALMLLQCLFNGLSMSLVDHEKWEPTAGTLCNLLPKNQIDPQALLLASILHASPCQPRPSVRTSAFPRHAFTLSLLRFHALPYGTFGCIFVLFLPPPLFFHTSQSRLCWISRAKHFSNQLDRLMQWESRVFISASEMFSCYGRVC